jgi:hypothetical protein
MARIVCFEGQAKDKIEVPPVVAKAFAHEVLEHIKGTPYGYEGPEAKPGGLSYGEALEKVSEKSGLQAQTINSILKRHPQVFSRTKQAVAKASDMRMIKDAADRFANELKSNGKVYEPGNIAKAWDLQRKVALGGHSVVFPWTHMRNWAVQIPTEAGRARMGAFWRAATDVYRYAGEKGQALYEMDIALMQMSDHYEFAKQSGLDVVPGKRDPGDILLQSKKPKWGQRNFDSLKIARYNAFEDIWSRADPALKGDVPVRLPNESDIAYQKRVEESVGVGKAFAAIVSRDLNYATGSVTRPVGEAAGTTAQSAAVLSAFAGKSNALLSSKLFFAKHMDATFGPLRYLAKTGRMTVPERAAANIALKRWANTVGVHLGILGANYAFNKMMGWETPNLTDPKKGDFLRLKIGGIVVPFSPMLEALRLPIVFTASMVAGEHRDAMGRLAEAAWNAAHPSAHTIYEQVSGKDYLNRPIRWSLRNLLAQQFPSTAPKISKAKAAEPVGGPEYALSKVPIALAGGAHEFYQSMRDQGIGASMAVAFLKGAAATAASAITGVHAYEQQVKPPKAPRGGQSKPMSPSQALSKQIHQQQRARQQMLQPVGRP